MTQLQLDLGIKTKKMAGKRAQTPYGMMVVAVGRACDHKNPSKQDLDASHKAILNYERWRESQPPPKTTDQIIEDVIRNRCYRKEKAVTRKKRAK